MIYTYEYNGDTYRVSVERLPDGRFRATVGDRAYTLEAHALPQGGWLLDLGESRAATYVAAQGNMRHVYASGQHYTLSLPETRASRRRGAGGTGGDLTAQMPGQVIETLVQEGDTVTRGQPMVILEAMKMELRVTAPADGRVKRLLVKVGEVVERGQLLVEME